MTAESQAIAFAVPILGVALLLIIADSMQDRNLKRRRPPKPRPRR